MATIFSVIAGWILRLTGWQVYGQLPSEPKGVVIGAPHTSNLDGLLMVLAAFVLKARLKWLVKDNLYKFPLNIFLKALGAIPINRRIRQNAVEQAVQVMEQSDKIMLALAPEGTRKHTEGWRSGFYYIALGAQVPIFYGFVDYKRKLVGLGGQLMPTGDIDADMEQIRAFYQSVTPRFPEHYGPIKLIPRKSGDPVKSQP